MNEGRVEAETTIMVARRPCEIHTMNTDPAPHDMPRWHPVARSADLRPGANIVAGFAQGQELALWRSADGTVQAWENLSLIHI